MFVCLLLCCALAVRCVFSGVGWSLSVCVLVVVCRRVLFVACCVLRVDCWLMRVEYCSLVVARCVLIVACRCVLRVASSVFAVRV